MYNLYTYSIILYFKYILLLYKFTNVIFITFIITHNTSCQLIFFLFLFLFIFIFYLFLFIIFYY